MQDDLAGWPQDWRCVRFLRCGDPHVSGLPRDVESVGRGERRSANQGAAEGASGRDVSSLRFDKAPKAPNFLRVEIDGSKIKFADGGSFCVDDPLSMKQVFLGG